MQAEAQQPQQLAQSPSLQPQTSWDTPFVMENYVVRGVGPEGRTRSNSTVSAGSMGGLMALDGMPMATKVRLLGIWKHLDSNECLIFGLVGVEKQQSEIGNRGTCRSYIPTM